MGTVLGLLGLIVFVLVIISLAAGVTWSVVKLIPLKETKKDAAPSKSS